mgnify:CR=1 FL=1
MIASYPIPMVIGAITHPEFCRAVPLFQYFFCLSEFESTTVKVRSKDKVVLDVSCSIILAVSSGSVGCWRMKITPAFGLNPYLKISSP